MVVIKSNLKRVYLILGTFIDGWKSHVCWNFVKSGHLETRQQPKWSEIGKTDEDQNKNTICSNLYLNLNIHEG